MFISRSIIFLTAIFIFGSIGWASIADIDQVSRASGQIIPQGRVQIVQSNDGGVIKEINVKEGDTVTRGQVLVVLDSVRLAASVEEASAEVASLKTIKARIEAELYDAPLIFTEDVAGYTDFIRNQQQLFGKRRTAYTEDISAMSRMRDLVKQELETTRPLLEYGDISVVEVLRLERSVVDIEAQIANKKNTYLQDLQSEYADVGAELVSAQHLLTQRLDALADTVLIAPADGIVKNVRLTTIGAVLRPSDEVLQIVPTGDELVVEAKVSPTDIAYVRSGQKASVNFDAYDSSIFGSSDGEVIYISPDTVKEQTVNGEEIFYAVHIRLDTTTMRPRLGELIQLQPGMTVTADILTGQNTVLNFLMKPIIRTVGRSFSER